MFSNKEVRGQNINPSSIFHRTEQRPPDPSGSSLQLSSGAREPTAKCRISRASGRTPGQEAEAGRRGWNWICSTTGSICPATRHRDLHVTKPRPQEVKPGPSYQVPTTGQPPLLFSPFSTNLNVTAANQAKKLSLKGIKTYELVFSVKKWQKKTFETYSEFEIR